MSPDPSVHEEQLEEIERNRRLFGRRRGCGCSLGCLFVLLLSGGLAGWFFQEDLSRLKDPDFYRQLSEKLPNPRKESPSEVLGTIREKAAALQKNWEKLRQEGKIEARLEELRTRIRQETQAGKADIKKQWQELETQSTALLEKVRSGQETGALELENLKNTLDKLESLLNRLPESSPAKDSAPESSETKPTGGE